MKVVSDTSPICYLLLIDQIDLLPGLFKSIFVPEAVLEELGHPSVEETVRRWAAAPPTWVEIGKVQAPSESLPRDLARLHRGEREAIQLADQISADLVLLDERDARRVATQRGLSITGLIGVLDRAASARMVELEAAVARLIRTNFRISPRLLELLLQRRLTGSS